MLKIAGRVFEQLGLDVVIVVNNRKILDRMMEQLKIPVEKRDGVLLSIDKLQKIGVDGVKEELKAKGVSADTIRKLLEMVMGEGKNTDKLQRLWKSLGECEGLTEVERVLSLAGKNVVFDPSLTRGLSYYTGTVFEAYLEDKSISSSVCGGGRYDKMINEFLGKEGYEAVGISFGLDVVMDALKMKGQGKKKSVCQAYVIPIQALDEGIQVAEELRDQKIACDVDLVGRGISKNLEYASTMAIPFVVFVGKKELAEKKVKLRNMVSGKEELLNVKDAAQQIMKARVQ
jgi:histidyl-tRNA synthetase